MKRTAACSAKLRRCFTDAGIPVKISDDIDADLWTKLVMNCAYNAICALSGARYGQMVAMPEVRGVMADAVKEVVAGREGPRASACPATSSNPP